MRNAASGDLSTDEDEDEKEFRLERIKDKSPEEIEEMNKSHKRCYTVMFNIFQTKDLMIVDSKGTNDPYVEISYAGKKVKSKKKEDLVNSVFNEAITFQDVAFDMNDVTSYPVFLLKVFDKNDVFSNKLIGFRYISVRFF